MAQIYIAIKRIDLMNILQQHLPYHKPFQSFKANENTPSEVESPVPTTEGTSEESENLSHELIWSELLQEWEEIHDTLVIFKIESFAQKLRSIAVKSNYSTIVLYADSLIESIDQLDIDTIKEQILHFPQLTSDLIRQKGS